MKNLYCLFGFVYLALLTGCAQQAHSLQTFDHLVIQNRSGQVIENITLYVPELRQKVNCSVILPESECALGFPERARKGHPAVLSWEQGTFVYKESLSHVPVTVSSEGKVLRALVTIYAGGKLEAHFE